MSLRELAVTRATNAGHPALADTVFHLRALRALGISYCILYVINVPFLIHLPFSLVLLPNLFCLLLLLEIKIVLPDDEGAAARERERLFCNAARDCFACYPFLILP